MRARRAPRGRVGITLTACSTSAKLSASAAGTPYSVSDARAATSKTPIEAADEGTTIARFVASSEITAACQGAPVSNIESTK